MLLFTERNAYQPGETVHLKAIVRERKGAELTVPARLHGTLSCADSRGQVFLEKKVALSADGSLDEAVRLPDGALGEYTASLGFDDGDRIVSQTFQVEEYKPNAFEITVKAKETFGPDETVEVPITAKYFFGAPLAKAAVRWSVEVGDSGFRPTGFGKYFFGWQVDDEALGGRSSSSFSAQGKGAVDEKGVFVLKPKITTNPKAPQPRAERGSHEYRNHQRGRKQNARILRAEGEAEKEPRIEPSLQRLARASGRVERADHVVHGERGGSEQWRVRRCEHETRRRERHHREGDSRDTRGRAATELSRDQRCAQRRESTGEHRKKAYGQRRESQPE